MGALMKTFLNGLFILLSDLFTADEDTNIVLRDIYSNGIKNS